MRVEILKEKILEENKIEEILEDIGCRFIRRHSNGYITCSNPDGDNKSAITVYLNDNLTVIDYTRDILPQEQNRTADILDLVMWAKDLNFIDALRHLCNICAIDYYEKEEPIPESLQILKLLKDMQSGDCINSSDDILVKPISEKILNYYLPIGNHLFEKDNISLSTQRFFEVGYDPQTNYITIPIRSEIGDLVGVKGRIFKEKLDSSDMKYIYLEPCSKSRLLYGLDKLLNNIIQQGRVFVVESEKAVMQLYEMGFYGVSTGGSKISKHQIQMLIRLGVQIIFAYDKDINRETIQDIANQFLEGVPVWAIIDADDILDEKESPSDEPDKWFNLLNHDLQRIR
jgi:DNA primase